MTLWEIVGVEPIASEPIISPACLICGTVGAVATSLARDICAIKCPSLETVFGSLLLDIGWEISRSQEFVDKSLILADAVTEHATMVSVVIETPLNVDNVPGRVSDNRCGTPNGARLVVIDADSGVISARTASSYLSTGQAGPSSHWLKNSAFWA